MYPATSSRFAAPSPTAAYPATVPMSRTERVFHIVTMITQFGGVVPLYTYLTGQQEVDTEVGDSSPINTMLMATILIVSITLGFKYRRNVIRALPGLLPVIAFLLLATLSVLWSDFPLITVRRSGTAVTTALWGAYLASRFSLRDIILLVAQSIGVIAVASIIAAVLVPDLGINELLESDPDGLPGWRGIVSDKNSLGIVMATGMVTMFYLAIAPGAQRRHKSFWLAGTMVCATLLYLSQSRTSWAAALVGIVVCVIVRAMYRRPSVGIIVWTIVLCVGIPLAVYVYNDLNVVTTLVGKDATLTGRVDLWAEVLPYGDRKPWLGYGYGAFWIEDSPMTQEIWRALNSYKPPHAHNGWIETYLELGLVGCFIVALQMLQMLVNATRATHLGRDVDAPYMLLIVAMMLIFNMVEADLIRAPALFWPFLIIGPVAMSKVMRREPRPLDARWRAAPSPNRRAGFAPGPRPNFAATPLTPSPLRTGAPFHRPLRPLPALAR